MRIIQGLYLLLQIYSIQPTAKRIWIKTLLNAKMIRLSCLLFCVSKALCSIIKIKLLGVIGKIEFTDVAIKKPAMMPIFYLQFVN